MQTDSVQKHKHVLRAVKWNVAQWPSWSPDLNAIELSIPLAKGKQKTKQPQEPAGTKDLFDAAL